MMMQLKNVFYSVLVLSLICGHAPAQQISTEEIDLGRSDPFAQLLQKQITLPTQAIPTAAQPVPPVEKPDLYVQTISLKFLDAEILVSAIEGMASPFGSMAASTKGNSIIICDSEENVAKIVAQIQKADQKPEQLLIEAVILDVQLDNESEIGVNWDILSDKMYDTSYRQNLGSRLKSVASSADTIGDTTVFNTFSDTGIEGGYFAFISGTIRHTIHLLQQKKEVEILASPRVMVLSGESASIETITELPYREVTETADAGQLSSTEFKNVGVKLTVAATYIDDDNILVTVEPEQNVNTGEFGTTSEIPIIDTRKAKTTLLLKDGQVVIMGGLRRKEITYQVAKIPFLSGLPFIGELFQNKQKVVKNSELLVLLSPRVFRGEPISEKEQAKYDEITRGPLLSLPAKTKGTAKEDTDANAGK